MMFQVRKWEDKSTDSWKCDMLLQAAWDSSKKFIDELNEMDEFFQQDKGRKATLKKLQQNPKPGTERNWFANVEDLRRDYEAFHKFGPRYGITPLHCRHLYRAFKEEDFPDDKVQLDNQDSFFGFAYSLSYALTETPKANTHIIRLTPADDSLSIYELFTKNNITVQTESGLRCKDAVVGLKAERGCFSVGFGTTGTMSPSARTQIQQLIDTEVLRQEVIVLRDVAAQA